ncbi:ARM repeat-containing protein [Rickenella mellea]|uniref:ARM repeat-containing protein n=1 Tax=Rickenella mellea TaxID=50990 RepID=A0A4Y7PQZ2_9AGAM|nr:ARM repeat-containing protein [Rickenella mellea]
MEDVDDDGTLFTSFSRYEEFSEILQSLLTVDLSSDPSSEDDRCEDLKFRKLGEILDQYQEQPYLLDPYLEQLVIPVAQALKGHAKDFVTGQSTAYSSNRLNRLALLMYSYIKFRGYKSITRYLPHEVSDLSIALGYMLSPQSPVQNPTQWAMRYIVLLWLSLICRLPFDLAQFDDDGSIGKTALDLELVAKSNLAKSGLEREGAALMLSRLYMRQDTGTLFSDFLTDCGGIFDASSDVFVCIGALQVLAEVTKSGPLELIQLSLPRIRTIVASLETLTLLQSNSMIRKLRSKINSRIATRLLPATRISFAQKGPSLASFGSQNDVEDLHRQDDDFEVPTDVEEIIEELFEAIQDKDTIVRWSAAKGLARISERLPRSFSDQVLDNILSLFSIHSVEDDKQFEVPPIAEGTWHGTCLACAEMARRGLVSESHFPDLVRWLSKALFFDVRKGAHSIGSSVRDAAAYVLWSLARTQTVRAFAPYANALAQCLIRVTVYDREIHIRRAASAAFQENVGRMGLFPHGIDVLAKTDFFAVSNRRNAFMNAAVDVARHGEYRPFLISHLLATTLRHWDVNMRILGAQSLRALCEHDLEMLGPSVATRAADLLKSLDTVDVHGGLLALTQLAMAFQTSPSHEEHRRQAFTYLALIPSTTILSPRNVLITEAACKLIAESISPKEIELNEASSVPHWKTIIDEGLKSRNTTVQEAAATALASTSRLVDCSQVVQRLIRTFKSTTMQQSLAHVLGLLDYTSFNHDREEAVRRLLDGVDEASPSKFNNIEARRNAFLSLAQLINTVVPALSNYISPVIMQDILDALERGLEDYTTNERGDVGSWVRMACIESLSKICQLLISGASSLPNFEEYLPPERYHRIIAGILKQGVERLDNVRQQAGSHFEQLLGLKLPKTSNAERWSVHAEEFFNANFIGDHDGAGWQNGDWLFPRAVQILNVQHYRRPVLHGLVLSVGSKTGSTQRPVCKNIAQYGQNLDVMNADADYDLRRLTLDLLQLGTRNLTANNIVVPVLQTLNILLEADTLVKLSERADCNELMKDVLKLAGRNIDGLKNIQRIAESMKVVVNMIPIASMRNKAITLIEKFLIHRFPKIRSDTAEFLYLVLQTKEVGFETDDVEEILLETEWSSQDIANLKLSAEKVVSVLPRN